MPNWCFNYLTVTTDTEEQAIEIFDLFTMSDKEEDNNGKLRVTFNKVIPMPESIRDTESGGRSYIGEILLAGRPLTFYSDGWTYESLDGFNTSIAEQQTTPVVYIPDPKGKTDVQRLNVYLLADLFLYANPTATSVTYGELVQWVTSNEFEDHIYKDFLDSVKMSIEHATKHIENIRNYGSPTWYEWACRNWGTKWDACHSEPERDGKLLIFRFDTAWCNPIPVAIALSKRYPTLEFRLDTDYEMEPIHTTTLFKDGSIVSDYETVNTEEDCFGVEYEPDDLSIDDPYFGQAWYDPYHGHVIFYGLNKSNLEVKLDVTNDETTGLANFFIKYQFFRTDESGKYDSPVLPMGEYISNIEDTSVTPVEMIKQDLIKSRAKLEELFSRYHAWTFGIPSNDETADKAA